MAIEAFSRVHDFLNNHLGFTYGPTGMAAQNTSFAQQLWSNFMNIVDIPLAIPLALNGMVSPELQPWLQDYYDSLRGKK